MFYSWCGQGQKDNTESSNDASRGRSISTRTQRSDIIYNSCHSKRLHWCESETESCQSNTTRRTAHSSTGIILRKNTSTGYGSNTSCNSQVQRTQPQSTELSTSSANCICSLREKIYRRHIYAPVKREEKPGLGWRCHHGWRCFHGWRCRQRHRAHS